MKIESTVIQGCYEIVPNIFEDRRGKFIKTFHKDVFIEYKLNISFAEEYYSDSCKRVLRGMHFQIPPHEHVKLVYCVLGKVMDVLVDLRLGSPTYNQFAIFELSDKKANGLYIPPGLAHGFYVMSDHAILMYKVTTLYSPEHDSGILWNSIEGIPWPDWEPIISQRDNQFVKLADFKSPFRYQEEAIYG